MAQMPKEFDFKVTTTYVDNNTISWWGLGTLLSCGCYDYCKGTHYGYSYSWSIPATIYKYQITCPKCKTMNWMEIDKITPCSKCKSRIKAVTEQVDYEVPVNDSK